MWNSNSIIAWILERSGIDASTIHPPPSGRAPGWNAGIAVARRDGAQTATQGADGMDAIRQATDSELTGNVRITADGRCKASGFWCPSGASTRQLRGEWLLERAMPMEENIAYMALEVERRVLGGAEDFEITLCPPAFRPDPAEDVRRLRAELIAAGGRLVSIAPGINSSGQYRYTVSWLAPHGPSIAIEDIFHSVLGRTSRLMGPLAPTGDHFGVLRAPSDPGRS
jgi:hypothetical protein